MPNHVKNRLVVQGPIDDVSKLKSLIINQEEGHIEDFFDFNRVIERPQILSRVVSPANFGPNGRLMLQQREHDFSTLIEATPQEQAEIDKNVQKWWYDWSIENWGTKWNSYNFQPLDDQARYEFSFDTAWSPPAPVIDKLVSTFPHVTFDVSWFDEGWCHAGQGTLSSALPDVKMDDLFIEPDNTIFETVYGEKPQTGDDYLSEFLYRDDTIRILDNFTCEDVHAVADKHGYFGLSGIQYSDDLTLSDDEIYDLRKLRERIRDQIEPTIV